MEEIREKAVFLRVKSPKLESVSRSRTERDTLKNIGETMVETEYEQTHMPLVGDDAPAFTAVTAQGPISFPEDYKGRWVVLFSHPADFTPVCTTES